MAALTQTNMKRLLAYSSIAHAGYLLMGVVALSENGARGLLVYLAAYLFMNLGAFLVVTLVHLHEGSFDLRDYAGLYRRAPLLTVAMAFFLLSLVGIPPFVGFLGKLYVFAAVIEKGMGVYATIAAVNAAIAAYYYFRVLKVMTIDAGNEDKPVMLASHRPGSWPSPWPTCPASSGPIRRARSPRGYAGAATRRRAEDRSRHSPLPRACSRHRRSIPRSSVRRATRNPQPRRRRVERPRLPAGRSLAARPRGGQAGASPAARPRRRHLAGHDGDGRGSCDWPVGRRRA